MFTLLDLQLIKITIKKNIRIQDLRNTLKGKKNINIKGEIKIKRTCLDTDNTLKFSFHL